MSQKFLYYHLFSFLRRFEGEGKPLDMAFSDYLKEHKSIGSHDRRFLGDTVYSLIRWKGLLDHLLKNKCDWEDRFNLYQKLDFSHLPPHLPLWAACGASPFLFDELSRQYGPDGASGICRFLNEPAPITVRVNGLKTDRDTLLALWQKNFDVEIGKHSMAAIHFKKRLPLTQLPEFKQGLFEIQDEGSQLIADLVECQAGEEVLDYCSGSGGKSLAITVKLAGKSQIYLHDIRPTILWEAKRRFKRAGAQNAQFLPPEHPRLASLKNKMDWVLVDAPCSGSGTYRRNPDMKWKLSQEMLDRLVKEQRSIFEKAFGFLGAQGKIVYATCSLFRRENEEQVEYFLKTLPLELIRTLSIRPEKGGPDGFFGAVFCKKR